MESIGSISGICPSFTDSQECSQTAGSFKTSGSLSLSGTQETGIARQWSGEAAAASKISASVKPWHRLHVKTVPQLQHGSAIFPAENSEYNPPQFLIDAHKRALQKVENFQYEPVTVTSRESTSMKFFA